MPQTLTGFVRPTLSELIERARQRYNAELPGADSRLRRRPGIVLTGIIAGGDHELYGYADWIATAAMPLFADKENLDAWGMVWGVARKPATQATGSVSVTGTTGSVVPINTTLQRPDETGDALVFETTAAATLANGTATLSVRAVLPGAAGNTLAGVTLSFANPVAGVGGSATVLSPGLDGGADREADGEPGAHDAYRGRILDRIRQPPHGGAAFDYERWALEVAGVTRAWPSGNDPSDGQVTLRFMTDDLTEDGIPTEGKVEEVQAYIDDPSRRPITVIFTAAAPVPDPVDVEIDGMLPNTADVQAAVEAELRDLIRRAGRPGGTLHVSKIWEAVSLATGEDHHTVVAPAEDLTCNASQIHTLGNVTFT